MPSDAFANQVTKLIKEMSFVFLEKESAKKLSNRAIRGRTPSCSTEFEDRFAIFLDRLLPKKYSILVDQPVSFRLPNVSKTITKCPDILIIDNQIIKGIFELKIDLGYAEDSWFADKQGDQLALLRLAGKINYSSSRRNKIRERKTIYVDPNIFYGFVILSDSNHKKKAELVRNASKFVFLCHNYHPNSPRISRENLDLLINRVCHEPYNLVQWRKLEKIFIERFA